MITNILISLGVSLTFNGLCVACYWLTKARS